MYVKHRFLRAIWKWCSRIFGYNQIQQNDAKGYITFENIQVAEDTKYDFITASGTGEDDVIY